MFRMNLIKRLQTAGFQIYAVAPYDEYSEKLKDFGVEYLPISMDNKGTSPKNDLKLIYDLYTVYNELSPDCILHFTIKPNIYGSIAAKFLRIPVVNNITGLGTVFMKENLIQKVTKFLYKYSFKNVNKVFFQNKYDKEMFLINGLVDEKKVSLLPGSGIDTKKFLPMKTKRNPTKITFLLIARVIRDKGIIEYVEAARIIKEKYLNTEFQILGQLGTINKSAISKDKVDQWQKENIINYLGTTEDVREHISNADCIILPSYREGTSKTLLEAASMAKPIVTTDVPGCNNVVSDGKNGYLCKVKDSIDLASKIEIIIKLSEADREQLGKNGRQKMINEFEEEIVIQKYLEAIEIILN